ncbi:MAG: DUF3795 domain-containing protein [Spirochaetes bacterium]|nr:DUF3795 domain-containing protein [Spirochaetota bacterium]
MISYCGLTCSGCPAFIATANDDDDAREKIAREWSAQYHSDIKPQDIHCRGCLNEEGRIFGYCAICEIRKCGRERRVANCASCGDYPCGKLGEFFTHAPQARETLESLRK